MQWIKDNISILILGASIVSGFSVMQYKVNDLRDDVQRLNGLYRQAASLHEDDILNRAAMDTRMLNLEWRVLIVEKALEKTAGR